MTNPPPALTDEVLNDESTAGDGVVRQKTDGHDVSSRRNFDGPIELRAEVCDWIRFVSKARVLKVEDLKHKPIQNTSEDTTQN